MPSTLRHRPLPALLLVIALLAAFAAATAFAASPTVKVGDNFYSAKRLSVSRGTTVKWKWTGAINHSVTVRSGPVKFSSRLQVHGTYSHRFTVRGTYKLYCKIHPFMKLTVVVR